MYRIGESFDIHRLVEGRRLLLGGVEIPSSKGEEAHSDGDVLLHAVTEALLGALGKGDLGTHFPSSDPHYKNIDSVLLLKTVWSMMHATKLEIEHLDTTIFLEQPHLGSYKLQIKSKLAKLLAVEETRVNIKAATMEGLGPIGEGQAVAARCVVLLASQEKTAR